MLTLYEVTLEAVVCKTLISQISRLSCGWEDVGLL